MLTDGISSLVIDELCERVADQETAVVCFYCDFQSQKTQTPENVLGALIKQIVLGFEAIPTEITAAFKKAKGWVGGRGLRIHEALELLKAAVAPLGRTFICIDALDELLEKHLPKLLRSLHAISQSCPGIRFFFTGRLHIKIGIGKYFSGSARCLQIKPAGEDVMRYVDTMFDDDSNPEAMDTDLRAEIMSRVSERISDVYVAAIFCSSFVCSLTVAPRFLLVSLNITAILDETTVYDRREQLRRITKDGGLGDAYGVTLERIKAQSGGKARLGMAALMWISQSERPMSSDELCHALGVQTGSTCPNPDKIPSIKTLLASCLGLVVVDREESAVRLVHFTLQEYLNSRSETFRNPYAVMAEVCLTYLNFDCIRKLQPAPSKIRPGYYRYRESSPALDDALQKYPFLEHASRFWGPYARNETTQGIKSLALQLLDGFDSHISAHLLLRQRPNSPVWMEVVLPQGFTGLDCVAYLGLDEIAEALLDMRDQDVDKAGFEGCTPLIWASMNGCEGTMRLLLKKAGANPDMKDTIRDQTPLSWAAEYGHEGAVRLLLEREEVNPESRNDSGRTPLSYAVQCGSEEMVKLLLERDEVNPDSRDNDDRTPLAYAAEAGTEGAVRLLLKREEVNPESRDNLGQTPLSIAAQFGWEGIVGLLLDREGVDPESRDIFGRTPFSYTAEFGGEGVVGLLLKRKEVNPESQDIDGRTPLSYAAAASQGERVVKLLLELREVNSESRDNYNRTPLSHAAEYGREEAVKLLLEREGANPESGDNSNRTPLSYAAGCGSEEVVLLLLKREEVNPESRDNRGLTPLSHAAISCRGQGAVKLLLERREVNPESQDNQGRTPLSYAAGVYPCELSVMLLLERKEVNPESRDNQGRTPLSHAASQGTERVVKLLLEREETNPESRDNFGRTPLSYAARYKGEGVFKLLLEREEVNPESRDNDGRTPISHAARLGIERVVKLLLEREETNPESRDNFGRTPLSYAASSYEGERAIKLLLEREEVNPESRDNDGRTPISHAASSSRGEGVVKLLLEREEVNPTSRDKRGRTPLSYAADLHESVGTVELLLERAKVNRLTMRAKHRSPTQPKRAKVKR